MEKTDSTCGGRNDALRRAVVVGLCPARVVGEYDGSVARLLPWLLVIVMRPSCGVTQVSLCDRVFVARGLMPSGLLGVCDHHLMAHYLRYAACCCNCGGSFYAQCGIE